MPEIEETPEPFALPEDFAAQVQAWDVPIEHLPEAVAQYKSLQTEEGIIDAFIQTGQSLGFGLKELERLFVEDAPVETPAVPSAPVVSTAPEPRDPNTPLTYAEVQEILAEERAQVDARFEQQTQAEQAREQNAFAQKQQVTFAAINDWYEAHGIDQQSEAAAVIARLGEATLAAGEDSYVPAVAVAALDRGFAAYDGFIESEATAYLKRKAAAGDALPATLSAGGTDTGGEDAAPNYGELGGKALATAKERVRARLRQSGELE